MNIGPFFGLEVFAPDDIKAMSIALVEVCRKLDLTSDNQTEREILAKRIIALARHGERDPAILRDGVLRELAVRAWRGLGHSEAVASMTPPRSPPIAERFNTCANAFKRAIGRSSSAAAGRQNSTTPAARITGANGRYLRLPAGWS